MEAGTMVEIPKRDKCVSNQHHSNEAIKNSIFIAMNVDKLAER